MAVYESSRNANAPLIEAIGLNKAFMRSGKQITAARDVSLSVRYGESVAIVGESGSGKTTAVRMALGLEQPDSGQVFYNGGNIRKKKVPGWPAQRYRAYFPEPLLVYGPAVDCRADS